MADIRFDEEPTYARPQQARKASFLARLVCGLGLAKDEAGAQRALLAILVVVILLIIVIWLFAGPHGVPPPPPPPPAS